MSAGGDAQLTWMQIGGENVRGGDAQTGPVDVDANGG